MMTTESDSRVSHAHARPLPSWMTANKRTIAAFDRDYGSKRLEISVTTPPDAYAFVGVSVMRNFPSGTWTPMRTECIRLDARAFAAIEEGMTEVRAHDSALRARRAAERT